jgi:hypothetical protein
MRTDSGDVHAPTEPDGDPSAAVSATDRFREPNA